jgi:hypothetical protein
LKAKWKLNYNTHIKGSSNNRLTAFLNQSLVDICITIGDPITCIKIRSVLLDIIGFLAPKDIWITYIWEWCMDVRFIWRGFLGLLIFICYIETLEPFWERVYYISITCLYFIGKWNKEKQPCLCLLWFLFGHHRTLTSTVQGQVSQLLCCTLVFDSFSDINSSLS